MMIATIALVLVISAHIDAVRDEPTVAACADGLAKYNVTFIAKWSKAVFPKQYPLYRPHAQWTKVIGRSHSSVYHLYEVGQTAPPALKDFVETGYSAEYDDEAQGRSGVLDIFTVPSINRGVGTSSAKIFVDAAHSKVSMVARIVPSPDWFVGVSSLNLCEEGVWVDHLTFDLAPMDAGTDKGMTFSAPNWAEDPQLPITVITSQEPHHPANSFFYPGKSALPPVATLEFRRISSYTWQEGEEEEEEEEEPTSGDADETVDDAEGGPVDCEVTEWEEWGACSKTCGFGTRMRVRQIARQSARSGTPCPTLEEQEFCGSMRSCGWKHFQFGGGSKRAGRRTFRASPSTFGDGRYRGRFGNRDTQRPTSMREPGVSGEDAVENTESRRSIERRSANIRYMRNY